VKAGRDQRSVQHGVEVGATTTKWQVENNERQREVAAAEWGTGVLRTNWGLPVGNVIASSGRRRANHAYKTA
jgi:hypothetical protein